MPIITKLSQRIFDHLAGHPDVSSYEIAAAIGCDYREVQSAVCRMIVHARIVQSGARHIEGLGRRPIFRVSGHA
jgi:hypothetical protein